MPCRGFYGELSNEDMAGLMAGKDVGTYIIRFSTQPGIYSFLLAHELLKSITQAQKRLEPQYG